MSVRHLDKTRTPLPAVSAEPALSSDGARGRWGQQSACWCLAHTPPPPPRSSESTREGMGRKNGANAPLQRLPQQLDV